MKIQAIVMSLLLAASLVSTAFAADVNYDQMGKDGFADVAALMKSMTPEQRAAVLKQAKLNEQDLQRMTPEQQQELQKQLRSTADTIRMEDIDPNKLNVAKAPDAAKAQKDLATYQTKYDEGKLHNSAIRGHENQ